MISRINTRRASIFLGLVILLTFQNCSSPVDESATDNSSLSYEESLPFAYTFKPDTIAHMSCSRVPNGFEPRAYFSYKVMAATSAGGIGVSPEFLLATKNYSADQKREAFGNSKLNANSFLQLSIRKINDYQAIYGASQARLGYDLDGMLGAELASPKIAAHLATMQTGEVRKYFPSDLDNRLVEGSLRFMASEPDSQQTRSVLADRSSLLVAGFTDTSDVLSTPLRGPSGLTAQGIFGVGFMVDFRNPAGFNSTDSRRALNSITEIDLKNKASTGAGWTCSSDFQFMVIRPEDIVAGKIACYTGVDRYDPTKPIQLQRLQMIRRVLRVEDWYVDVANRCIVPKTYTDFCYGDRTGRPAINYTASAVGGAPASTCTGDYCPHYVTICSRQ